MSSTGIDLFGTNPKFNSELVAAPERRGARTKPPGSGSAPRVASMHPGYVQYDAIGRERGETVMVFDVRDPPSSSRSS
jgi:hypothetical protein